MLRRFTVAAVLWGVLLAGVVPIGAADEAGVPQLRRLAPGVMMVIPSTPEPADTYTGPIPLVEITRGMADLEWTPNYTALNQTLLAKGHEATMRRPAWQLEFSFKPLRLIHVDVPQPTGRMQRKGIWYLVYRVRYLGNDLQPVRVPTDFGLEIYRPGQAQAEHRRFFPHFVLSSREVGKEYLDQVIPSAQEAIQERERPGVKLHNSIEMSQVNISVSDERTDRGVWGVAMWEDVDPAIDFLSVYVQGLTNAYRIVETDGEFQPGDPPGTGRTTRKKTLQLNFWRPGDEYHEDERQVYFGLPHETDPALLQRMLRMYGLEEPVDYRWVYR